MAATTKGERIPNGSERNWVRLCHAINGFRAVYRAWPTRVRLPEICLADLREHLFTPETFSKLETKLQFIADGSEFIIEDELGNSFSYAEQLSAMHKPDVTAEAWLRVDIDRSQPDPFEHLRK